MNGYVNGNGNGYGGGERLPHSIPNPSLSDGDTGNLAGGIPYGYKYGYGYGHEREKEKEKGVSRSKLRIPIERR